MIAFLVNATETWELWLHSPRWAGPKQQSRGLQHTGSCNPAGKCNFLSWGKTEEHQDPLRCYSPRPAARTEGRNGLKEGDSEDFKVLKVTSQLGISLDKPVNSQQWPWSRDHFQWCLCSSAQVFPQESAGQWWKGNKFQGCPLSKLKQKNTLPHLFLLRNTWVGNSRVFLVNKVRYGKYHDCASSLPVASCWSWAAISERLLWALHSRRVLWTPAPAIWPLTAAALGHQWHWEGLSFLFLWPCTLKCQ